MKKEIRIDSQTLHNIFAMMRKVYAYSDFETFKNECWNLIEDSVSYLPMDYDLVSNTIKNVWRNYERN